MNIETILTETKKASMLQLRGKTIEAARMALGVIRMAVQLKSNNRYELAQNAFYRLNMCWYALMDSNSSKERSEADSIKSEAVLLLGYD